MHEKPQPAATPSPGEAAVPLWRTRRGLAGLAAFYLVALAPGLLLIGSALFGWWKAPAESERDPAFPAPAAASQVWSTPAESETPATLAAPHLPAASAGAKDGPPPARAPAAARVKRESAAVSTNPTCTDLRALFGLGEKLTEAQRNYLQERC